MDHYCHQIQLYKLKIRNRLWNTGAVTQQLLQNSSLRKIKAIWSIVCFLGGYVHLFCLQKMKYSSYYIITCNCYCLSLNPFFISCEIYFIYIFCKNLQKTVKKTHRFHVLVAYINMCLRDQINMRHHAN